MALKLSKDGESLIKFSEGYADTSFLCGARVWSLGYSRTRGIGPDQTCTRDEAEEWFEQDSADAVNAVERMFPGRDFTQGQIDALASFIYNFGEVKFQSYSIFRKLREGQPWSAIENKWLEYIYSIRDDDRDDDMDAMIDNGLPIRRYQELLIARGFSWPTVKEAVTANTLDLSSHKKEWKNGGFKEVLSNPTPIDKVVGRARALSALWSEPQPDDADLFEEGPVIELEPDELPETDIIEPGEDLPSYWDKLTESEQAEFLNLQQKAIVTGEPQPPIRAVVDVQPVVRAVEIADVPYLDTETPMVKPIEESQRGRGYAKTETGKQIGGVAVIGTAATSVGMLEPVVAFVDNYPKETIAWTFFGLLILGVICFYFGKWQRQKGEDEATDLLS